MTNIPPPQAPQPPPLDFPADLQVEYVNLVRIAHSLSEIVFDFAQVLPGGTSARVQSRVLMSPVSAKLFYRALAENLSRFEAAFGEIKIPGGLSLADTLFRSPDRPEPK